MFPAAEDVCPRTICLPVHASMTNAEVNYGGKKLEKSDKRM